MPELAWVDGPQGRRTLLNVEKDSPQIGLPLQNGAICVAAGEDDHGHTFVLAVRTDMPGFPHLDRYVTWECSARGETFLGHYHDDLGEAFADFNQRLGRA